MPLVQAGEVRLYVEEAGNGSPVLFIAGLGSDHHAWASLLPALTEHFRCITFDNRDSGASDESARPYTVVEMAQDAVAVLDAVGVMQAHVVGTSMGGAIAQQLALRYPDRVARLVLLSTYTSSDERGAAILRTWLALQRALPREAYLRGIFPWLYTVEDYAVPGLIEGVLDVALHVRPPQSPSAYERQMAAALSHNVIGRLSEIRAPVLVLFGEDDILTPLRFARSLVEELPNVRLQTFPRTGHSLPWTRSEEVGRAIRSFLVTA
jgi:pimeloyl-ACP methyl ester carboxylesterase